MSEEQFYSEDGCDKWLAQSGLLPERGIYVDAGCAHPWRFSQTAFLRNRGWTGLAIDGDLAYAPEWAGIARAKFVNAVLSDKNVENFLTEPSNALVSRVHELGQEVTAYKLPELIRGSGIDEVQLLSLDIEGSEAKVLDDMLVWNELLPSIIVVEFNSCHLGRDPQIFNMFARSYDRFNFELVHLTDSNAIFAR